MDFSVLGKTPVSEENPTGNDPSYAPEFEELEAEVEKSASPSSAETTDWNKVVRLGTMILSQKSKDLRVASRVAVGRIHLEKLDGFVDGVKLFSNLISIFWDNLFPPRNRMRGRTGAIEWWLEKAETILGQQELVPMPAEEIENVKNELTRLQECFQEHLKDPPSVRNVQRVIESIPVIQKIETPSETEDKPDALDEKEISKTADNQSAAPIVTEVKSAEIKPVEQKYNEIPATVAEFETITSEKEAVKTLKNMMGQIRQIGSFLRDSNLMDPLAYRCTRMASWILIESLPPVHDGNKTRIPPPDIHLKNSLEELQNKKNYEALIKVVEGRISQYLFWLDLNRLSAQTLLNMGDSYRSAHDAVCQETANFIQRLQGLDNIAFQDGTPFADEQTKVWIKTINPAKAGAEDISTATFQLSSEKEQNMDGIIQSAQELVQQKKIPEALSMLQSRIYTSVSAKEKMLWRMALSQLLISTSSFRQALPHLDQLIEDIDHFSLETWEPELALKGLQIVYVGLNAALPGADDGRADNILYRIARLDTVRAMKISAGS